jgi:hypothetical protein
MSDWQSMADAPRDGTPALLAVDTSLSPRPDRKDDIAPKQWRAIVGRWNGREWIDDNRQVVWPSAYSPIPKFELENLIHA